MPRARPFEETTTEDRITEHAATRVRQRGVDPVVLDMLLTYGTGVHDHLGAEILVFDNKAFRRMECTLNAAIVRRVVENRNLYAVRSMDGAGVTVGHRVRKLKRN